MFRMKHNNILTKFVGCNSSIQYLQKHLQVMKGMLMLYWLLAAYSWLSAGRCEVIDILHSPWDANFFSKNTWNREFSSREQNYVIYEIRHVGAPKSGPWVTSIISMVLCVVFKCNNRTDPRPGIQQDKNISFHRASSSWPQRKGRLQVEEKTSRRVSYRYS